MRLDETNTVAPTSSSSFLSKVIGKKRWRPDDVIMWPQMTFQRGNDATARRGYQASPIWLWFWVSWADMMRIRGTSFFYHWLIYNGEVMKLTRPEVTDMKNPRYTTRRYVCPYCTLWVSKSLDLWWVFDRLSNFEKCNLRSGHLMWPGGVTFGVFGSSFFRNVPNCWLNSYGKFGGATRRRFFRYLRKTWGAPLRFFGYPPPGGGGG